MLLVVITHMRQATGSYRGTLHVIAVVMLVSILLPLIVAPPKRALRDRIALPERGGHTQLRMFY